MIYLYIASFFLNTTSLNTFIAILWLLFSLLPVIYCQCIYVDNPSCFFIYHIFLSYTYVCVDDLLFVTNIIYIYVCDKSRMMIIISFVFSLTYVCHIKVTRLRKKIMYHNNNNWPWIMFFVISLWINIFMMIKRKILWNIYCFILFLSFDDNKKS